MTATISAECVSSLTEVQSSIQDIYNQCVHASPIFQMPPKWGMARGICRFADRDSASFHGMFGSFSLWDELQPSLSSIGHPRCSLILA
jgi:hypothetical protein